METIFLDDKLLVVRLATEKLDAIAEQTAREGWKWFESISPSMRAVAAIRGSRP